MNFQMQIADVFRLSNGRTVFVGTITNHPGLVQQGMCELQCEGERRQQIALEGEQIVKKVAQNDYRALATLEDVHLTSDDATSGRWTLVGDS